MNKLPQITLAFWVMKMCATTHGETAGDLLSMMASFCQVKRGQAGCCQIHKGQFMIRPMSRIRPSLGSQAAAYHKKRAPHALERPFSVLPGQHHSVVIRECCLVSFMVA